jgi:hypothetical protein
MNIAPYVNNKWLEVQDNFKIKVGLATIQQLNELESLIRQGEATAIANNWMIDDKPNITKTPEFQTFIYKTIEYKLKDWDGLTEDDTVIKCIVTGDKLSEETMTRIRNLPELFILLLFRIITESAESFKISDKKK